MIWTLAILGSTALSVWAGESLAWPTVGAPPLEKVRVAKQEDLGIWEDLLLPRAGESIFLRRSSRLFSFLPGRPQALIQHADRPELSDSELKFAIEVEGRPWLFFVPQGAFPFALDLERGTKIEFRVPGVTVDPGVRLHFHSPVVTPHAGRLLIRLSRGGLNQWPQPWNAVVTFWVDLRSGLVRGLPVEWNLLLLSGDLRLAAFSVRPVDASIPRALLGLPEEVEKERPVRPEQVWLDLQEGREAEAPALNERTALWSPVDGTTGEASRALVKGPFPGPMELAGVSVNGVIHRLSLLEQAPFHFGWTVDARGGWARLAYRDSVGGKAWVASLDPDSRPVLVGTNLAEIELLADGRCVQTAPMGNPPHRWRWLAAQVTDVRSGRKWNVLDGVAGAPVREMDLPYVNDELTVRLVRGVGASGRRGGVLCLAFHHRFDLRSQPLGDLRVPTSQWSGAILVSDAGKRFEVEGFNARLAERWFWYHNGGTLVTAEYDPAGGGKRVRVLTLGGD